MRTSLAACMLLGAGAAGAAVVPDLRQPSPAEIAEHAQSMVVQVLAGEDPEDVQLASGVLAGGGIVLTDLRAVLVRQPDGGVAPASNIAVETAKGVFAAHLVAVAIELDVAVLRLPDAALALDGLPIAEEPAGAGDPLVAIRASRGHGGLAFEAIDFSVELADRDGSRLRSTPELPVSFAGAPILDAHGSLAGLLVTSDEEHGLLVPAVALREILRRVRTQAQPSDDI